MRTKLFLAGLFTSITFQAQAQPSLDLSAFQGARAYYQTGFSWLDTSGFNSFLEAENFSPLSSTFIMQGGGAEIILDRVILGAAGYGLNGFQTATADGESFAVNGGYGLFKLGYQVISEPGFSVYPILGIGSGQINARSSQALNQIFNFTGDNAFEMQTGQIILDLALGADYMIDFNGDPQQESGVNIGLRLGYVMVPSPQQWQSGQRLLAGQVPQLSMQGPYLQLSLGGGTQASYR